MKILRNALALIEHNNIQGEFDSFYLMSDTDFQKIREKHLARRSMPSRNDDMGVTLLLAAIGSPGSLVAWLFSQDEAFIFGAVFWLIAGVLIYYYLAVSAKYWREHYAIIAEEIRRYGRASFG